MSDQQRSHRMVVRYKGSRLLLRLLVWTCLLLGLPVASGICQEARPMAPGAGSLALSAGDVLVPEELGRTKGHFQGRAGSPIVFLIGESHVSRAVQRSVAGILTYLRGAFDVKVVCSEGFLGPLPLPKLPEPWSVRRDVAEASLNARHINGVEYVALAYPDVRVVGVEKPEAYEAHRKVVEEKPKQLQELLSDLQSFLLNEVGKLPMTSENAQRVKNAIDQLKSDHDLKVFVMALYPVVGRESAMGRKLAVLDQRLQALTDIHSDDRLLGYRDVWIRDNTVREARMADRVALVVGCLHLSDLEGLFRKSGTSFVTILPSGLPDNCTDEKPGPGDRELYERMMKGTRWPLEEWLSHMKPPPALTRETFMEEESVLGALIEAARLLRNGQTPEKVIVASEKLALPAGFKIKRCFNIAGGYGIAFDFKGRRAYAYFAEEPSALAVRPDVKKIDEGVSGSDSFVILDGGSGNQPPILPIVVPPPGPRPFDKVYLGQIEEQRKKNPGAVTFRLAIEGKQVVRWLGDQKFLLAVSLEDFRRKVARLKAAKLGPDKISTAQGLARELLIDIDLDLPPNSTTLYQFSEDDLLGDLSLPHLAGLAASENAEELSRISEVYMIPWKRAQQDLTPLSERPTPVDIHKIVVWISDDLRASAEYSGVVKAMQATGVRVNEDSAAESTLILLGAQKEGSVTLNDGTKLTASVARFAEAIQKAHAVVALNFKLSEEARSLAKQIHSQDFEAGRTLGRGLDLVKDIEKSTGKESVDRVLRKRGSSHREEVRKAMTLKDALGSVSVEEIGESAVDAVATELQRG